MKKICGICRRYLSCEDADEEWEVARYADTDWGYCQAPVPICVDNVGNNQVNYDEKAKHCPCFKKEKK